MEKRFSESYHPWGQPATTDLGVQSSCERGLLELQPKEQASN